MNDIVALLAQFLVTGASVVVVAALMPGMRVHRYADAVGFAVVVAVLNVVASRLLVHASLPHNWLVLGVVGFVVNGLVFLVARSVVRGVEISGCLVASIAALLVSVVNGVLWHFIKELLRGYHV